MMGFSPNYDLNISNWRNYQDTYIYYKAPVNSMIHNRLLYGAGGIERYWVRGFDPYWIVENGILKFAATPGILIHTWTALVYETHNKSELNDGISLYLAGPGLDHPLYRNAIYYVGVRYTHGVIGDLPDALPTFSTWNVYLNTDNIPEDFFHLFTFRVKPGSGTITTDDIELLDHRVDNCAKTTVEYATKIKIPNDEKDQGFEIYDGEHGPYYIRPDDDGLHFEDENGNHIDLHARDLFAEYIHCYGIFVNQENSGGPGRYGVSGFINTEGPINTKQSLSVGGDLRIDENNPTYNFTGFVENAKITMDGNTGNITTAGTIHTNGNISTDSSLNVDDNVTVGGTISSTGNISTDGSLDVDDNVTVGGNINNSGTISSTGNISTDSSLIVDDNVTVGGTISSTGNISTDGSLDVDDNVTVGGNVTVTGTITGSKVYNAVYNDIAESFEKNEKYSKDELEEIIVECDKNGKLIPAKKDSTNIIGIVSTDKTIAYLLGPQDESHVPVALAGTVYVKSKNKTNTKHIGKFIKSGVNGKAVVVEDLTEELLSFKVVAKIISVIDEYHYKVKVL